MRRKIHLSHTNYRLLFDKEIKHVNFKHGKELLSSSCDNNGLEGLISCRNDVRNVIEDDDRNPQGMLKEKDLFI